MNLWKPGFWLIEHTLSRLLSSPPCLMRFSSAFPLLQIHVRNKQTVVSDLLPSTYELKACSRLVAGKKKRQE